MVDASEVPTSPKSREKWGTHIRKFSGQVEREFNLP
jgi:hypothetical protein